MVETYKEQVRSRPAVQQDLSVRVDPDAFGAGIGRAMGVLGEGINKFAQAKAARDTLTADNDARAAQNAFIEEARNLRFDPATGYMNQTGANALGRRAAFEDSLAKARDKHAAKLSPQARRKFMEGTDNFVNGVRESAIKHDSEQLRTYTNNTAEATAATFLDEALLTYNDPVLFASNVDRAAAELDRINALNGASPKAAEVARNKLVSGAYAGAAVRMADEGLGGAVRAQEFINENADKFTAEDRANLQKVLKPLVERDSARVWVNDQAGVTPRPSETYSGGSDSMTFTDRMTGTAALLNDPYARQTRKRESGSEAGRLDAAPYDPATGTYLSTARGPYQFIEGTWLAMVKRARAKGGAAWAEGLSNDEILEYRWTGGAMAGRDAEVKAANDEIFVEFREYNQNVLIRNGFEASPENEYLLHLMGEGGGINFLRASDGAFVESVIGLDAAQKNNLVGVTVGQYKRRLASAYGAPGAPGGGAEYDWAKLYADAAKLMETDPEKAIAVIAELDARRAAYEASQTAGRQQTFNDLYEQGVTTGNWNLSAQDAITLGADLSEAFRTAGQNHMQGTQYTDPIVFTSLQDMAATDPENFLRLELADFLKSNELTDGDYRALRTVQTELQSIVNPSPAQAGAALSTAMSGVDPAKLWTDTKGDYELFTGVDPNSDKLDEEQRAQIARFRIALTQRIVEETQAKGAALTPLEQQAVVMHMLEPVEVETPGTIYGTNKVKVPRFDAGNQVAPGGLQNEVRITFDTIPNDLRTALSSAIPAEVPQGERKAQVERLFNDMLAVAEGRTPEVTIEDVPAELYTDVSGFAGMYEDWFGEGVPDETAEGQDYLIDDGAGGKVRVTEEQLLSAYAKARAEEMRILMQEAKIDPAKLRAEKPTYVIP